VVCENFATQQCYSAAIAAISQYFVLNSVLCNSSDQFKLVLFHNSFYSRNNNDLFKFRYANCATAPL